jgi:hypothetical protein
VSVEEIQLTELQSLAESRSLIVNLRFAGNQGFWCLGLPGENHLNLWFAKSSPALKTARFRCAMN